MIHLRAVFCLQPGREIHIYPFQLPIWQGFTPVEFLKALR